MAKEYIFAQTAQSYFWRGGEKMKKLLFALIIVVVLAVVVASPVSAQVPADEACVHAIPKAQAAGVTLPFDLCVNLP